MSVKMSMIVMTVIVEDMEHVSIQCQDTIVNVMQAMSLMVQLVCMYQHACRKGVCINTDGSYQCQEGQRITSDVACQDTDECQNVSCFKIHSKKF